MIAAIGLAAGGAVLALLVLDRLAIAVVKPVPRPSALHPERVAPHVREVAIPAEGQPLAGWELFPDSHEKQGVVLLVHGWGASYEPLLDLAAPLVEAGHRVLVFDVRGHGGNPEVPYVTARHFRDDIVAALRFAAARYRGPTVLVGHSMGGACGVLAAAEGAPIDGLAVVASPADILEATATYLTDRGLPGRLMVAVLRPFWWVRVGGTFGPLTPERRVGEVPCPVLVVHPEKDTRVPLEHARRLARSGTVRLVEVAGAGHTDVLRREETHRALLDFLGEVWDAEPI